MSEAQQGNLTRLAHRALASRHAHLCTLENLAKLTAVALMRLE